MMADLLKIRGLSILLKLAADKNSRDAAVKFFKIALELLKSTTFQISCKKEGEFTNILLHIKHYDPAALAIYDRLKTSIVDIENEHGPIFSGHNIRIILKVEELENMYLIKEFTSEQ